MEKAVRNFCCGPPFCCLHVASSDARLMSICLFFYSSLKMLVINKKNTKSGILSLKRFVGSELNSIFARVNYTIEVNLFAWGLLSVKAAILFLFLLQGKN